MDEPITYLRWADLAPVGRLFFLWAAAVAYLMVRPAVGPPPTPRRLALGSLLLGFLMGYPPLVRYCLFDGYRITQHWVVT